VVAVEQVAPHNLYLLHCQVVPAVLVDITKHLETSKTAQAAGLQVVVQVAVTQTVQLDQQTVVVAAAATGMAHGLLI
jgi:hypothetical protein